MRPYCQAYGKNEFDKAYMGHTATIEIDDVVKLLVKKTFL